MFPAFSVVKKSIEALYDASADIYVDDPSTDKSNITSHARTKLRGTVRCRISYKRILPVVTTDTVDNDAQQTIMIYSSDTNIRIPDGSKIAVKWDDGRTDTFQNSGLPKVYQYTTQVELEKADVHP